ncbi:phosphatidylinositol/phosphatidylcholine transfer protein SFH12-like [Zingiber officinale]|uniref:phosphatidylinositol/phosphatidylcholine transfer protein SFH12-like n=1 Tax=Zingiber officinale TaxID=94328 RepID=UPI001C4CFE51|nr:phosphatidylinositol/phosphatidylcholine transfer protein SFH12-like [Zingiber officinale]
MMEITILSKLPNFLGGLCTYSSEGGCLKFNKGPWNNPNIMEGRSSSTWTIESGSNIDDQVPKTIGHRGLALVYEELKILTTPVI